MLSVRNAITLALMLLVLAEYSESMPAIDKDKERFFNSVNVSIKRKLTWHSPILTFKERRRVFSLNHENFTPEKEICLIM